MSMRGVWRTECTSSSRATFPCTAWTWSRTAAWWRVRWPPASAPAWPVGTCSTSWLAVAALLLHLGFLYRDGAILNRYEDRMTAAVAGLKDARVVIGLNDPSIRANPFTHMIDRACLGVCYSFGNYEPSTAQIGRAHV